MAECYILQQEYQAFQGIVILWSSVLAGTETEEAEKTIEY